MRGKPGPRERILGVLVLLLLALVVGVFLLTGGLFADTVNRISILRAAKDLIGISERPLFLASAEDAAPAALAGQAHFADAGGGLQTPGKIERYTDNLYEKINGKESMFRAYLFVELRFARYLDAGRQDSYDVYIFDMGQTVNALGIYMAERSREAEVLEIGREGYASGTNVYFYKSKYYVNVLGPVDGGPPVAENSKRIAAAIADTITDAGEPFWAEAALPVEDRVPHSFSYVATSALGYDFLAKMFRADYRTGGTGYQMYLIKADTARQATELFNKFAEATTRYDKVISRETDETGQMIVSESLGVYGAAFHAGTFLAGVVECEDQALAADRAAALRERLLKHARSAG